MPAITSIENDCWLVKGLGVVCFLGKTSTGRFVLK
jgi:hypothetical protein